MVELQLAVKEAGVLSENYLLYQKIGDGSVNSNVPPVRLISNDNDAADIALFLPKKRRYVELFVEFDKSEKGKGVMEVHDEIMDVNVGIDNVVFNGTDCELEQLHDSEYESAEDDMCVQPNSDQFGGSKGNLKANETGNKVEWSFGAGVKGRNVQIDYDSDNGLKDYVSDDDRVRSKAFNPKVDMEKPTFELGMKFADHKVLVAAIKKHAILERRQIYFVKQVKKRVRAKCKDPCPWILFASTCQKETNLVIKTLNTYHSCANHFKSAHLKPNWLAQQHVNECRSNHKNPAKAFKKTVMEKYNSNISMHQAYRTKRKAFELIDGSVREQYFKLWDYGEELRNRNPGSSVIMTTEEGSIMENMPRFQRFYVCLGGLKEGFKLCRKVICLDGCFLKGEYGGQLLAACGIDPNNNWYPVCYAIVEAETKETWNWFVHLMITDLSIVNDSEYVIMSDKQKGLIDAISSFMPNAEHRFCVMHMLANMRTAGFRGLIYRDQLWSAACATTEQRFKVCMETIAAYNKECHDWFADKPPHHWSRSHFGTKTRCDILLNNLAESFNSTILDARDKPILACLETIRNMIMSRLEENRQIAMNKWSLLRLCPKIHKELEKRKKWVGDCIPVSAGAGKFQVTTIHGSQYSVNVRERTCTCRKWELSGIPCNHAISCLFLIEEEAEGYVDPCYRVETYKKVYSFMINPMDGPEMWGKTGLPPVHPPKGKRNKPGRPKKLRKRTNQGLPNGQGGEEGAQGEANEDEVVDHGTQRLQRSLYQRTTKCSLCKVFGHNKTTCPSRPATNEENNQAAEDGNIRVSNGSTISNSQQGTQSAAPRKRKGKGQVNTSSSQSTPLSTPVTTRSNTVPPPPLEHQEQQQVSKPKVKRAQHSPSPQNPELIRLLRSPRLRSRFKFKKIEGTIDLDEEEEDAPLDTMSQPPQSSASTGVLQRVISYGALSQPPPGVLQRVIPAGMEPRVPDKRFTSISVSGKHATTSSNESKTPNSQPFFERGGKQYVTMKNLKNTAKALCGKKK